MGKGSKPRPIANRKSFEENFEAIFGKKEKNPDVDDTNRVRYRAHPETGEMVPDYMWAQYNMLPKEPPRTAFIQGDYQGYQSPITGKWIEGRRAHKYDLQSNGCRVYEGRESETRAAESFKTQKRKQFEDKLDDSMAETLNDIKYGNNPPPEQDKNGDAKLSWTFGL